VRVGQWEETSSSGAVFAPARHTGWLQRDRVQLREKPRKGKLYAEVALREECEYVGAQFFEWEVVLGELLQFKEPPAACLRQESLDRLHLSCA
jgi:hypothetical protein